MMAEPVIPLPPVMKATLGAMVCAIGTGEVGVGNEDAFNDQLAECIGFKTTTRETIYTLS
jgi:hypothetical protein